MPDLLSEALTGNSGSSMSAQLVAAYKLQQQPSVDALTNKKTDLENKQSFYSKLNTQINTIVSQIDRFAEFSNDNIFNQNKIADFTKKFITRKTDSSNTDYVSASAESGALLSTATIKVNRLAKNDVLISDQLNLADSFGIAGNFTFQFQGKDISVDLDGTETNETAMTKIVKAINLNNDLDVTAALVKNTTSTARISFTAKETGEENALTFSDSELLAKLGLDNSLIQNGSRSLASDNEAGFRIADSASLNAEASINGITVTRSTNAFDDVLPGVKINLLKVQDAEDNEISLTTKVDRKAVEDLIKPLFDAYNSLLSFLDQNKSTMRGDSAVSSLKSNIRSLSSQSMNSSAASGEVQYLTDVGVKIASDGKLSIGDTDRLQKLLENDPESIAKLFTGEDGFAAKLQGVVSNLIGNDGLIQSRRKSLTSQIESTKKKTDELNAKIDYRANIMRKEYESMLQVYLEAQSQMNYLNGFNTNSYGYY